LWLSTIPLLPRLRKVGIYPGYMENLLGQQKYRCEYSKNNHFMCMLRFKKDQAPANWLGPTQQTPMPYDEWRSHANVTDDKLGPDMPH
jgi:hypothetical protein